MKPTRTLFLYSARLTLFTRANCSLCDTAKSTIARLRQRREVDYSEVDVMASGQKQWKDLYEFDTPVLHVQRVMHAYAKPDVVVEAKKLMHRFSEEDVEILVDEAEGHS